MCSIICVVAILHVVFFYFVLFLCVICSFLVVLSKKLAIDINISDMYSMKAVFIRGICFAHPSNLKES